MVGTVMDNLKKNGIADNTLVVFINDNGGTPLTNSSCNAPLNGMKGTLLEGGIRVPFAMQWPGKIPAGKVYDKPVISLDIMSTALGAAGVSDPQKLMNTLAVERETKVPEIEKSLGIQVSCLGGGKKNREQGFALRHVIDSVDLMPYVTGKTTETPHTALFWFRPPGKAVRKGDWKLVVLPDRPPMLFDLKTDISEKTDLAHENPAVVKEMMKDLFNWEKQTAHPMFRTEHYWLENNTKLYDRTYKLEQPQK